MPNKRRSRKGKSGKRAQQGVSATTVNNNAVVVRLLSKLQILESQVPVFGAYWFAFILPKSSHPLLNNWSMVRIKRIGIEIPPYTYLEFLVRGEHVSSLNTRAELLSQQDVLMQITTNGGMKRYWFAPSQAIYRGWQEIHDDVHTGMFACLWGVNHLLPGTDGILCQLVFDYELKQPNTGHTQRHVSTATLCEGPSSAEYSVEDVEEFSSSQIELTNLTTRM